MTIRWSRRLILLALLPLVACATLTGREPVLVDVVGVEPLPGQGMEGRFLVRLRVQNPNTEPVEFDGVAITLDVRGNRLASGVSDVRGTVPRFGEAVLAVPVTVPVSAMLAQALSLASGDRARLDYELRGRLAGPAFGGVSFRWTGELTFPKPP
jgi:LEA14-like dessication related protein